MSAPTRTTATQEPAAIPARRSAGDCRKGVGRIIGPKPKYPPRGQRRPHTWQTRLAFLLAVHGRQKTKGGRHASNRTLQSRREALYGVFRLLREAGFKLEDPANLDSRHVAFVLGEWNRRRALHDAREPGGMAPATVASLVSVLRAFCGWIGQPQLMDCLRNHPPGFTNRSKVASHDLTWEGNGLDTLAVIERAWAIEPWVSVALLLQFTFGLREREAVMFRPDAACWPGESAVAINIARPNSSGLRGKASAGSKGGRPRIIMVRAAWENAVLEFARCFVHGDSGQHGHLGAQGRGLMQNMRTYRRVLEKLGVTRKECGVSGHGLRAAFAVRGLNRQGLEAPVRGGDLMSVDKATRERALRVVAEDLGHSRPSIGGAYYGPCTNRGPARSFDANPDDGLALRILALLERLSANLQARRDVHMDMRRYREILKGV
jgi:hypothetical protein